MRTVAIIPARLQARRLAGKPLADLGGRPLVIRVAEQVRRARRVDQVLIATDSSEIADVARAHGIESTLTAARHPSGTDRVAEAAAAQAADAARVLNVQGDEPFVDPADLDALIGAMSAQDWAMATLARPIQAAADWEDPNVVKVVRRDDGQALYFSRAAIAPARGTGAMHHLGVYLWRPATLQQLAAAPPHPLERAEGLEQLRALALGLSIGVVTARAQASRGIDTLADLDWARARVAELGEAAFPAGASET